LVNREPHPKNISGRLRTTGCYKPTFLSFHNRGEVKIDWTEKYRPKEYNDVVGQEEILRIIANTMGKNRPPNMIFHGGCGTGKTTLAKILSKRFLHVHEVNACEMSGEELVCRVEDYLRIAVDWMGKKDKVPQKLVVVNEADYINEAKLKLLSEYIERYGKRNRFLFITNDEEFVKPKASKDPRHAIKSRCMCFEFSPLHPDSIKRRLQHIIEAEGVIADDLTLEEISPKADGDMRRAITALQARNDNGRIIQGI